MKRAIATLGLMTVVLILGACSSASANNPGSAGSTAAPAGSAGTGSADAIQISSMDLKFSTSTLTAPANKPFQIVYHNHEGAPHNVAIYDSSFSSKVFGEEPFGGPKEVTYNVPALAPGTYGFRCDVHTDMKGTLEVK
jgi:plastocyanin